MMPHPLLELHQVTAGYNHQPVFQQPDWSLVPRQFVALVGLSGRGKSTLLKTILGLVPCLTGTVQRDALTTIGYATAGDD